MWWWTCMCGVRKCNALISHDDPSKPADVFSMAGGFAMTKWLSFSSSILNAECSAGQWRRAELKRKERQSSWITKLSPLGSQPLTFEHVAWVAPDQEDETLNVSGWNEICQTAGFGSNLGEKLLLLPVKNQSGCSSSGDSWWPHSFLGRIKPRREPGPCRRMVRDASSIPPPLPPLSGNTAEGKATARTLLN